MQRVRSRLINVDFNDISGGLNLVDSNNKLADNEFPVLQNFEFTSDGSLLKRRGSSKYNSTVITASTPVHSLYRYYKSATAYKKFMAGCGLKLLYGDDAAGTWTEIGSNVLTVNTPCTFLVWGDLLYIANGSIFKTWDGTTLADVAGSPPLGRYIALRKDRIYIAGNSSNPNRIYFCDTGDPTIWNTGTNYIDCRDSDGDVITGLLSLGDNLVIYKNNSIWLLAGTTLSSFFQTKQIVGAGCSAPKSLVSDGNVHYFLHRTGVYIFDGTNAVLASRKVNTEFEGIPPAYLTNAAGVFYKRCYWVSYTPSGQTENRRILVFAIDGARWTYFSGINARSLAVWSGGMNNADTGELYSGESISGFVWKLDTGGVDGTSDIEAKLQSKSLDFGDSGRYKQVRFMRVVLTSSDIDAGAALLGDFSVRVYSTTLSPAVTSAALWDSALWDSALWVLSSRISLTKSVSGLIGRSIALKILESSSEQFGVLGWGLSMFLRGEGRR